MSANACPKCGSHDTEQLGYYETAYGREGQQWECNECECFWDQESGEVIDAGAC
jgi:transposase-like protein